MPETAPAPAPERTEIQAEHTNSLRRHKTKNDPLRIPRAQLGGLLVLSSLLLLATPIALWCSRGNALLAIWRLSTLLSGYLSCWAKFYAPARPTFLHVAFIHLFASYADATFAPVIGMLVVYLNPLFAAGVVGYAVADCRQSNGAERSAAAAVDVTSRHKNRQDAIVNSCFFIALVGMGGLAHLVYTLSNSAAAMDEVAADFSLSCVFCPLVLSIVFVTQVLLGGALIGEQGLTAFVLFSGVGATAALCFSLSVGELPGLILLWIILVVLAAFLGYCISVYHTFLALSLRSQLPMESSDDIDETNKRPDGQSKNALQEPDESNTEQSTAPPFRWSLASAARMLARCLIGVKCKINYRSD